MTRIERRVQFWQKRLGLSDWIIHVEINRDPSWAEEMFANIAPISGRKEAVLTISSLYTNKEDLEHTIAHELCHLILEPVAVLAQSWRKTVPSQTKKTYDEQWEEVIEQVGDAIARRFVKEPSLKIKAAAR